MKDTEQARDFIETTLNGLEKSVSEKNKMAIQQNTQSFNSLISEYRKIIGRKSINIYLNDYTKIIEKGESKIKWLNLNDPTEEKKMKWEK